MVNFSIYGENNILKLKTTTTKQKQTNKQKTVNVTRYCPVNVSKIKRKTKAFARELLFCFRFQGTILEQLQHKMYHFKNPRMWALEFSTKPNFYIPDFDLVSWELDYMNESEIGSDMFLVSEIISR